MEAVKKAAEEYHLPLEGILPEDDEIQQFDLQGRPTIELGPENSVLKAAYHMFEKILNNQSPAY